MNKACLITMAALAMLPGAAAAQAPPAGAPRVAVVNQDRVLNDSDEGKRLKADLEKLRNAKAASIEAKEKEIKGLQDQALSAQLSLSEEKREEIARQLKRKRVEYERLNDDASAEFQDAANRAQQRLIGIFREMIAKYGEEKGYTVILERGAVYFAATTVDITEEVLARFNETTRTAAAAPATPK